MDHVRGGCCLVLGVVGAKEGGEEGVEVVAVVEE